MDEYDNIVGSWLKSMNLQCYLDSFLDNGYDELEICKQIGDLDMDAIGVYHPQHRQTIRQQVQILQEKGGFHVYFILDPKYSRPHEDFQSQGGDSNDHDIKHEEQSHKNNSNNQTMKSENDSHWNNSNNMKHEDRNFGGRSFNCRSPDANQNSKYSTASPPLYVNDVWPRPGGIKTAACSGHQRRYTAYSTQQLSTLIHDKLTDDCITLASWVEPGMSESDAFLQHLSSRYSKELNSPHHVVYQALLNIFKQQRSQTTLHIVSKRHPPTAPCRSISLGTMTMAANNKTIRNSSHKSSTASSSFSESTESELSSQGSPPHTSMSPLLPSRPHSHVYLQGEQDTVQHIFEIDEEKPKLSTLSRLFKSIGGKRDNRKTKYQQFAGDLHASQITMPDEERIDLMILVKEGKISASDAVEKVKVYESSCTTSGAPPVKHQGVPHTRPASTAGPVYQSSPVVYPAGHHGPLSHSGATIVMNDHRQLLSAPKPCNTWRIS